MGKLKSGILWLTSFVLSAVCLILSFPILLFTLYPYSIVGIALYVVAVVVLTVFSFRKSTTNGVITKRILFCVLLVPLAVLIAILISVCAGWINYPG